MGCGMTGCDIHVRPRAPAGCPCQRETNEYAARFLALRSSDGWMRNAGQEADMTFTPEEVYGSDYGGSGKGSGGSGADMSFTPEEVYGSDYGGSGKGSGSTPDYGGDYSGGDKTSLSETEAPGGSKGAGGGSDWTRTLTAAEREAERLAQLAAKSGGGGDGTMPPRTPGTPPAAPPASGGLGGPVVLGGLALVAALLSGVLKTGALL